MYIIHSNIDFQKNSSHATTGIMSKSHLIVSVNARDDHLIGIFLPIQVVKVNLE